MTTTRASEMDNLRSVVRFRPDQSGLTGRTGPTVRTGPLDGPRPPHGRGPSSSPGRTDEHHHHNPGDPARPRPQQR